MAEQSPALSIHPDSLPPLRPLCFVAPGQATSGLAPSSALKRTRAASDVDGNPCAMDVSKKRRLRKQFVTSRLSSPYSEPAAHIATAGRCNIALWARQRPSTTSGLRRAALLNAAHLQMDPSPGREQAACSHQSGVGHRTRRASFEEDRAPPVPCTHPPLHVQNPNFRSTHPGAVVVVPPLLQHHATLHMSDYDYDALDDDDIYHRSHAFDGDAGEHEDAYVPHPDFARKSAAPRSDMFVSPLPSPSPSPSPSPPRRPVAMALAFSIPVAQPPPTLSQSTPWTRNAADALISPLTMSAQFDFDSTMAQWLNLDTTRPPSPPDEALLQWFRDGDLAWHAT